MELSWTVKNLQIHISDSQITVSEDLGPLLFWLAM